MTKLAAAVVPLFPTSQRNPNAEKERELAKKIAELDAVKQQYQASLQKLNATRDAVVKETMDELRELVFAVGRELALKDLTADPTTVQTMLSDLVQKLGARHAVVVRVSDADAPKLQTDGEIAIKPDPSLLPGSCVIDSVEVRVDASFSTREEAVRAALDLR